MKRRTFLKSATATAGFASLSGIYAWQIEPLWLEFVHRPLPIRNLPNQLTGKTLMQLSDIHVGPLVRTSFLVESFKRARLFEPDFVVYTGDYIHYKEDGILSQLNQVAPEMVKGQLGTVAILGNHDYGEAWAQSEIASNVAGILEKSGISVLRNTQTAISGLHFLGLDDYWGTHFFPEKVLESYDSSKANLVLCHNPDVCDLPIWNNYQGWILAGHTHGGQVKPPFLPAPVLPVENKAYDQGEINLTEGRKLYINRGLGHLWQVRFNVRPEITVFTLQQAP